MNSLYEILVSEFGREKQVLTAEEWATVEAMGTYEMDYKNGELYSFNGKLYLLESIHLPMNERRILIEYHQ